MDTHQHVAAAAGRPAGDANNSAARGGAGSGTADRLAAALAEPAPGPALSIVVCTYKRPTLLAACLASCLRQAAAPGDFEIVVVDNDADGSARPVVDGLEPAGVAIRYVREPEANIAHARNRGVVEARGRAIAFIDDDFIVPAGWLGHVLAALADADVDVVLGDVRPIFEAADADATTMAPAIGAGADPIEGFVWADAAAIAPGVAAAFTRGAAETAGRVPIRGDGHVPGGRSGNAVLRRHCFAGPPPWFDPAFGRSGGEDSDFFMRLGRRRPRIVRSAEAFVYDVVPKARQTPAYVRARARREGRNYARLVLKYSRRRWLSGINLIARGLLQAAGCGLRLGLGAWLPAEQRLAIGIRLHLALGKAMLAGAHRDVPYR